MNWFEVLFQVFWTAVFEIAVWLYIAADIIAYVVIGVYLVYCICVKIDEASAAKETRLREVIREELGRREKR